MTPPTNSQNSSASKHSSPNDLTRFIIPSHAAWDSGGFGSIYKCIYEREGESVDVAVKAIYARYNTEEDALWREIGIWKRMRHDHIVPFLGTTTHISTPCYLPVSFVSLWMPNGTLSSYVKNDNTKRSLAPEEKYNLLRDVADGLHYLHSESVVHGDLTSKNVLINGEGQACLTDFGLSSMKKIGDRYGYLHRNEPQAGALHWSAPELIPDISDVQGTEIVERYIPSTSSDIYSYGCIMYEVLSGDIPWGCHGNIAVLLKLKKSGRTPERPKSEDMQDEDWIFVLQCWLSLPSLRPFASQALKFARTRRLSVSLDQVKSCGTSNRASIYSAHLDGANVYNLSLLVRSHPQPAFSDPAICWKSIDKLAEALIGLFTTKQNQHGLIDAIQLYHVSLATLKSSSTFVSSSLHKKFSTILPVGTEQGDIEAIERMTNDGNPLQFACFSYLSLHGIAEHITNPDLHIISRVKYWYRRSFSSATGDVLCRLQIALACARITETENIGQADFSLEAYETSLQLLQQHVSAIHEGAWAEPVERLATSLAVDAAAAALHLKNVNKAVELLEWGRELLWAYIVQSRTSKGGEQQTSEADRIPCPHPSFSDLLKAAQDCPVVVLIASRRSCDAIIVSNALAEALHVPLKISPSSLAELSTTFQACTSYASGDSESVEKELEGVLQSLWVNVVSPVIDGLKNVRPNSRIWWYPTSVFSTLPVHAAGEYTSEGKQLSTFYVSSYTSSITSLLRARTCNDHPESFSEFAAIYQAKSFQNDEYRDDEYAAVEFSEMEVDVVRRNLPAPLSFTRFANATKEDANEAFETCGWFHLIAYATQNAYQPLNSSFLMRDGSISIPDILSADSSPKEFAFLSARPLGSRFSWMQDEVIQFATGLQISGFKSVVGTMGDVDDSKARQVIKKFYKAFFRRDTLDCTRAAQALHDALEDVARDGLPLRQRIAFAHFGL